MRQISILFKSCLIVCATVDISEDSLILCWWWQFFNRLYLTETATHPTQCWKDDFQSIREKEPPDCWDMESSDGAASPKDTVRKTWRGAATFIPKVPGTTKKQSAGSKQVRPLDSACVIEVYCECIVCIFFLMNTNLFWLLIHWFTLFVQRFSEQSYKTLNRTSKTKIWNCVEVV